MTIGDGLIIVHEQNLMVDFHLPGKSSGNHNMVRGKIASNMPIRRGRVVIMRIDGTEQPLNVRSQIHSKSLPYPSGYQRSFWLMKTNYAADATVAGVSAAKETLTNREYNASIKGANRRIGRTVREPLRADHIALKAGDGERSFGIDDVMIKKLSKLQSCDSVILLADNDNKVTDMTVQPR